jgi:hypothetical protein
VEFEHEGSEEFLVLGQLQGLVGADDEDQIITFRPVVLMEAEGFAEEALDAIAARGGADGFGEAEAEARMGEVIGTGVGDDGAAGVADAGFEDGGKFGARADAEGFGEGVGGGGHEEILATDGARMHTDGEKSARGRGGVEVNLAVLAPFLFAGVAEFEEGAFDGGRKEDFELVIEAIVGDADELGTLILAFGNEADDFEFGDVAVGIALFPMITIQDPFAAAGGIILVGFEPEVGDGVGSDGAGGGGVGGGWLVMSGVI